MTEYPIASAKGREMLAETPPYFEEFYETRALLDAEGKQLDELQADIRDAFDQAFVDTATWGLDRWEQIFGIPTDTGKPVDQRRSVIKSKIRGTGTVRVSLIQSVAQAYSNGTVTVSQQTELYQFTVQFSGQVGAPPNLGDLKAAIDEIKPAHLAVVYTFRYLTIAEVEAMTIAEIEDTTLDHFSGGGL
jgi:uncharacterized protein YmfQ (DUF2313 family)